MGVDIVFANRSVSGEADEKALRDILEKYREQVVLATRSDGSRTPLCQYALVQHAAVDMQTFDASLRNFSLDSFPYALTESCAGYPVYSGNSPSISLFAKEIVEKLLVKSSEIQKSQLQKSLARFDVFA